MGESVSTPVGGDGEEVGDTLGLIVGEAVGDTLELLVGALVGAVVRNGAGVGGNGDVEGLGVGHLRQM